MDYAINCFFKGFMIGSIGTCIGGIIASLIKNPNKRVIASLFMFTAGLMLAIISFDLLPESYEIGGIFVVVLGLINGLILIFLVEELVPLRKFKKYNSTNSNYIKMGVIIFLSMAIHNLPEGLALGSSYVYSNRIGFKISLLIALHNIPEGMSIGIPLKLAGSSDHKIVFLTLLAGFPTALGAFMGSILGNLSNYFIGFCLSTAASTMLYVICSEMIPEAITTYKGRTTSVSLLIGFIFGCFLSFQF